MGMALMRHRAREALSNAEAAYRGPPLGHVISRESFLLKSRMVEISLSGSGEGPVEKSAGLLDHPLRRARRQRNGSLKRAPANVNDHGARWRS